MCFFNEKIQFPNSLVKTKSTTTKQKYFKVRSYQVCQPVLGATNMHEHIAQSCFAVAQLTLIKKRKIIF